MSRRSQRRAAIANAAATDAGSTDPAGTAAGTAARASLPTVTVCRDCCCGTAKILRLDHEAQLAELRALAPDVAKVRRVDCLDACEHANVIVVQPSAAGRLAGGRPVWLGLVNDPGAAADITAWVTAGGPGLAEPPDILELYAFTPSRRVRSTLDK